MTNHFQTKGPSALKVPQRSVEFSGQRELFKESIEWKLLATRGGAESLQPTLQLSLRHLKPLEGQRLAR